MLLGIALPCLAVALLAIGYAAGWHEGYRQAWLAMVPKRAKPGAVFRENAAREKYGPDWRRIN